VFSIAKEITMSVLKTFSEKAFRGTIVRLQVVKWNDNKPVLEKREFYLDGDGGEKTGKAKGLTKEDVEIILAHKGEILTLMA
jgi:hypothetical protein